MKKKILVMFCGALLLGGCGRIPKLSNGDDAIITFDDGHMISANDLYNTMKDDYALTALVALADSYVLEKEFADYKDTATAYAESYIKGYIEEYGSEDEFLLQLQQAGYSSIEAYQNYVYLSYMQTHAAEEYSKMQISDEDIEKYYKNEIKGDVEISHILITPEVTDDMTDEEKTEAENKAKKQIEDIIAELDKADNVEETFKQLVSKYSQDEDTKSKDGSLGRVTYNDLPSEYDELLDHAYRLKVGGHSTEVITTELGYHVILKTNEYEKEPLETLKEEIVDDLATQYRQNNSDVKVVALKYYREKNKMKIIDDKILKQYDKYIENLLASYQQAANQSN